MSEGGRTLGDPPRSELRRLLVADRGAAALRARRWGEAARVEIVALISDQDGDALWPDDVDFTVYVPSGEGRWPAPERVLAAAYDAGCDAIHPGYTALGRTTAMVELLSASALAWAGAGHHALGVCSDRSVTRTIAEEIGLQVVPASLPILDEAQGHMWTARVGLPVRLRSAKEGGGARRIVREAAEIGPALQAALAEGPVIIERLVLGAREIEVPVLWDGSAAPLTLGDRDLTVHDTAGRVVVEAPAPGLSDKTREQMAQAAGALVRAIQLRGLCAVRFLVAPDGRPYLLQVIPGLSPWHAVTEALFAIDLFDAQLRLATGDGLRIEPADLVPAGHHVWMRLRAEAEGELLELPDMELRRDLALVVGDVVGPGDEIGAVVVGAPTRQAAIVRARASLDGPLTPGVPIDRRALDQVFDSVAFWGGPLDREAVARLIGA